MSEHDAESVYSPAETDVVTSPEPASSPEKLDVDIDEDESPSPLLKEEPKSPEEKKDETKTDDLYIADNSHLIV